MPIIESAGQYGWTFASSNPWRSNTEPEEYPWLVSKKKITENRILDRDDRLCDNCNQLDFTALFHIIINETAIGWKGKEVYLTLGIKLGGMKDIERKESRCSFCGLVWQTILPNGTTQALRDKDIDIWLDNFAMTSNGKITLRNHHDRRGPAIIQLEVSTRGRTATSACFSTHTIHVLPQTPVANPKDNEFWCLLKWLDSCEECQHDVPLNEEESSQVKIHEKLQLYSKVIDVHRRRIVKAPKGCRYLALSYVWGGMNFSLLTTEAEALFEQDGSIELEKFPKTICDAIELCRELGERYLWIDSMCITQDSEGKYNQVQRMEAIYRGAVLTVVAAAGDHADVGLPGFSAETFRFRQNLRVIQGLTLANMSPSFEQSVDLSHWNTRAWTYQERLLSHRLVIFTRDQLYFQCDHGRAQADSGLNPHNSRHVRYLNSGNATRNEAYRIELRGKVNIKVYAQMVKEYSSRQLSFVSDIEHAFGGISKLVHMLFGSSEVLFGIPISGLALGLLWTSKRALKRRSSLSSSADAFETATEDWPTNSFAQRLLQRTPKQLGLMPPGNRSRRVIVKGKQQIGSIAEGSGIQSLSEEAKPTSQASLSTFNGFLSRGKSIKARISGVFGRPESFPRRESGTSPPDPITDILALPPNLASSEHCIFPSWSWMGWIGPVEFLEIKNLSERTISKVKWLDPLNKLRELPDENFTPPSAEWTGRERWLRQVLVDDQIYYTQKGGDRHHWFCHPMEPFFHDPIPINRDTCCLHISGRVARFQVVSSKNHPKDQRYLQVLGKRGAHAGTIILDGAGSKSFEIPHKCILLIVSQTTLKEGREDPAWDAENAAYNGKPGSPAINAANMDIAGAGEWFDPKEYDPRLCWCLYNVLMLERVSVDQLSNKYSRIGIGKLHIRALVEVAEEDVNNQVIELC